MSDINSKRKNEINLDDKASNRVDDHANYTLASDEEFPRLSVNVMSPSKPPLPKKPNFSMDHELTTTATLTDGAVQILANLINSRSDALENMVKDIQTEVKGMKVKMNSIEKRVDKSEETVAKCSRRVSDLETYGRRWNLKLHGMPEDVNEDVRELVIAVCQEVLPSEKNVFPAAIDVAHRLGKRRQSDQNPRGIIFRFVHRRHREAVWKAAKNNGYLQGKGLRLTEDLSKEDRENRVRLWPIIKKAREENKKAYFVGGRGFIEGVEIAPE